MIIQNCFRRCLSDSDTPRDIPMVINADEWWSTDMRRDDEGNAGNPFTLVADTRSTRFRSLRFPGRTSDEAFLGGDVAIWGSEWVSDCPFYVKNDECWCFISWPKEQNEDLIWNVVYGLQNLLRKGFVPWRWWWWWCWWWWRPRLEVEWCYISMLKTEIRSQQDSLTLVCSLCPALSHWSLRWWCFCPWTWLLWYAW